MTALSRISDISGAGSCPSGLVRPPAGDAGVNRRARRVAGALDKKGINSSTCKAEKRERKMALLESAQKAVGKDHPMGRCLQYVGHGEKANGQNVVTLRKRDGKATVGNVTTCKNRNCPHCGSKLAARYIDELKRYLEWAFDQGSIVLFETFTIGHNPEHSAAEVLSRLKKVKAAFGSGRLKDTKIANGWHGEVYTIEPTHGASGWHPHIHQITVLHPDSTARQWSQYLKFSRDTWVKKALSYGFQASHAAQDQRIVHEMLGAAEYLNKYGAQFEMASHFTKEGTGRQRSIADLLGDFAAGDQDAGELYKEWVNASKGKRMFQPAGCFRGLKGDSDLFEDISEDEGKSQVVCAVTQDAYETVRDAGQISRLLEAVENSGQIGAMSLLANLGVSAAAVIPPERVERSWGFRSRPKPENRQ